MTTATRDAADADAAARWTTLKSELASYFFFCTVVLPLAICLTALVFGGVFAAGVGWSYRDGFLYVVRDLLDIEVELTDKSSIELSSDMKAWDAFVSFWAFGVVVVAFAMIYEMALCKRDALGWALRRIGIAIEEEHDEDGDVVVTGRSLKHALATVVLFVFIVVPLLIGVVSVVFGGLLAAMEGWSFDKGALYLISEMADIKGELVEVEVEHAISKICLILVDCWALAVFGSFVGLFVTAGVCKPWVAFERDVHRRGFLNAWRRIRWRSEPKATAPSDATAA